MLMYGQGCVLEFSGKYCGVEYAITSKISLDRSYVPLQWMVLPLVHGSQCGYIILPKTNTS